VKLTIIGERDKFNLKIDPVIFESITDIFINFEERFLDIRRRRPSKGE
jgi:hypothetical protein